MNITQVHVVPKEDERVKGYASIVLEECFLVNDIKIISGTHGCFISMPSRKRKNGKFRDIAHPITKEMREKIGITDGLVRVSVGIEDGEDILADFAQGLGD